MKVKQVILTINFVSNNHGLIKINVVWAYPLVIDIIVRLSFASLEITLQGGGTCLARY